MSAPVQDVTRNRKIVTKADDRQRQVAASLRVANPVVANAASIDGINGSDYAIDVDVMEVKPYEHNPRGTANPQYEEIKASIARVGLRTPLCVTRRPGEAHYIIEAGGNSRLLALQSLYQETASPAFRHVRALYRPWKSESHVLTSHLIENDTRGELLYWDRARALMRLRQELESEAHITLSLADFQAALCERGYAVSKAALGFYAFAVERLSALGDRCALLTSDAVKCLQQGVNRLRRHAEVAYGLDESTLYRDVIDPALHRSAVTLSDARRIDPMVLLDQCARDLAHMVCRPAAQVRAAVFGDTVPSASGVPPKSDGSVSAFAPPSPVSQWRCPLRLLAPIQSFARTAGFSLQHAPDIDPSGHHGLVPVSAPEMSIDVRSSTGMSARALSLLLERCAARAGEGGTSVGRDIELLDWLLDPEDRAADEFLKTLRLIRDARPAVLAAERAHGGRKA